jgi:hypothetical protein
MPAKTSRAADRIADELAEAEARTNRLRAKAEAINTAVREERDRAELSYYRIKATKVATEYRNGHNAVASELEALITADPIDASAILAKVIEVRDSAARCGALAAHASRLDYLSPLPPNPNSGAAQARTVPVGGERYKNLTFTQVLDAAINARAERIRRQHLAELQTEAASEISAAVDAARAKAASEISDK